MEARSNLYFVPNTFQQYLIQKGNTRVDWVALELSSGIGFDFGQF